MSDVATKTVDLTSHKPRTALAFVSDQESEGVIRQSLSDLGLQDVEVASGDVNTATLALGRRSSPRLLIVDISGVDNPSVRLGKLAQVCEPGTGVIVIGDSNDIRLYRELRSTGINEYFFKPLIRNLLANACNAVLSGGSIPLASQRTGRLIFVLGVRGGVGATTIAVSTAWDLAEVHKRWVLLMDLDLFNGDAALQLDAAPSHALAEAIEHPDHVDELFLERGVIHVTARLDLLASLEALDGRVDVEESGLLSILQILLLRYRFVFIDVPATLALRLIHVLHLPSLCILVSNGTLVAARDVARWVEMLGPNTVERSSLFVLNQSGAAGSLPEAEFIRAAGRAPDIIIPYHREVGLASNFGIKAIQKCATLRRALVPVIRQLVGEAEEPPRPLLKRLFG
jgi:pilus assembly protein CpaE